MLITKHTSFAGILGWPLDSTLSPVLHNAAFRYADLDWIYLAWPVPPADLADAVAGLRALGCMGANVTMPHKEEVVASLDGLSGDARAIGAVNTIQRLGDKLVGHNTDVDGFREFLVGDAGWDPSGRSALVLGAGGAARAVIKSLVDLNAGPIFVGARDRGAGERVAELFPGAAIEVVDWERTTEAGGTCDLVVNATPVGSDGEDPLPGASFGAGRVVIDLLYDPPSTPLIERARADGASAWGGLGMLVRQAAASFSIWTGRQAPIEVMSAAAVRAIGGSRP